MTYQIVPVCYRCGQRKARVMVRKGEKRVPYCRKCVARFPSLTLLSNYLRTAVETRPF
jgi:hypothetical protein